MLLKNNKNDKIYYNNFKMKNLIYIFNLEL